MPDMADVNLRVVGEVDELVAFLVKGASETPDTDLGNLATDVASIEDLDDKREPVEAAAGAFRLWGLCAHSRRTRSPFCSVRR